MPLRHTRHQPGRGGEAKAVDLGLRDRVVIVTGGGSGIGEAVTRACLAEGAIVAVLGRGTPHVLAVERELASARCTFTHLELADTAACTAAVHAIATRHGGIFALVNNAGVNDNVGLEHGTPERFLESVTGNLGHYYIVAHAALPWLKAASSAAIVNVSSKVAVAGQGGTSGYAAAKGAQLALTREWAVELAPLGIRVNAIIPAEVMTPLYHDWAANFGKAGKAEAQARLDSVAQRIPLGHRMTTAEEIAAAVVFLLSPIQSSHTTGQWITVDGGYVHLDRAVH